MTSTEHALANLLQEHASRAPGAQGLLAAVHSRSRQKARRRAVIGAIATVAVFSATVSVVAVTGGRTANNEVVLAWQNASESTFLVPTDLRPSFPLTPSYLPPGLDTDPRLSAERGAQNASWERVENGLDGPLSGLSITVSPTKPDQDELTAATPVDIGGTTAALRRYEGSTVLTWQRTPQQWVYVSGAAPVTEAETLTVARSLRDEPIRQPATYVLDVTPAGFVLAEYHGTGLTLGPAAGTPNPQDDPRAVIVAVRRASDATDGHGTPVRVGERGGWLDEANGRHQLVLRMDNDLRLDVSTPSDGQWNRDELARFVNGISYSGDTPRREG